MTPTPLFVRFCALGAPACLFLYGILRWIDGLDGDHGPGVAWNIGHTLFFVAFLLLGALMVGARRLVPSIPPRQRAVAGVATVAALIGAASFLWVTLGDLFPGLRDSAPLPGPLEAVGPLLFQIGALTLLIQLAVARRLPPWSPVLVFLGFLAIGVNLDLLPLGAALIGVGLAPVATTGAPGRVIAPPRTGAP
jgi:hypothetical protein